MKKIELYIAMSIDGFIADSLGGVDWLVGESSNGEEMSDNSSYSTFIKSIDYIVMGESTYDQVVNELAPNNWPYDDKIVYVLTTKKLESTSNIVFVNGEVSELVQTLMLNEGGNVWICGGANVVNQFVKNDLIDHYHFTIIPTLLGSGVRLFNEDNPKIDLKLLSTEKYDGVVELVYTRRN